MSEFELKPCPFCGLYAQVIKCKDGRYIVGCPDDGCYAFSGVGWCYETRESAIKAWNTRAECGCGEARDEAHIARLSNGFQCDGSVWRCCKCGAFFTNYTDLTTHHKPRFCPNCGAKVVK